MGHARMRLDRPYPVTDVVKAGCGTGRHRLGEPDRYIVPYLFSTALRCQVQTQPRRRRGDASRHPAFVVPPPSSAAAAQPHGPIGRGAAHSRPTPSDRGNKERRRFRSRSAPTDLLMPQSTAPSRIGGRSEVPDRLTSPAGEGRRNRLPTACRSFGRFSADVSSHTNFRVFGIVGFGDGRPETRAKRGMSG